MILARQTNFTSHRRKGLIVDSLSQIEAEEQHWRQNIFQGGTLPEFTTRAVIVGILLGVLVMSENVYMGLKTGITEAGSILSAILCFAIFRAFRSNLSILENNISQTLSSAAGSIGIIVSVVPALQLVGFQLSPIQMFIWVLLVAYLGLFFAIPLRRQFIVSEKLAFPTGTACATTISAMHASGGDAMNKAKALGISGIISGAITWFRDAVPMILPTTSCPPLTIGAYSLEQLSLGMYWSPLMAGVGLMIGIRVGLSLLLGGIVCWAVLGPMLTDNSIIEKFTMTNVTHWTMWPAIALMVASGFTSLAMNSGLIARTFKSMKNVSMEKNNLIEFPFRGWLFGIIVVAIAVLVLMELVFHVSPWVGVLTMICSFIFSMVAVRGYGETDISPVGTMGHANQIVAGILAPGEMVTNLAAGGVTAGCSDVASDLMQVLKTGHILGASPRRQIYAQFIGVTVGAITAVFIYLAITGVHPIGSDENPTPGALPWSGLAKILSQGVAALPPHALLAVVLSAAAGVCLTFLEKTKAGKFIPSPFGIGIGMVVPGFFSVSICFWSVVGALLESKFQKWSSMYLIPVASAGIAGEAIVGVVIAILTMIGVLAG